ncbi:type II toxin-antitoxin system RelB/DinJ family antitoxin [candidate division KSB1 bacterium]|nr:type II toxin-antitoxin system RelB/DinJ family antitoxin [candidate division KSB1 bacterium]
MPTISARIKSDLKSEVEEVFKKLGLSTTEAIVLFFHQVRLHKGLPFEVKIPLEAKIPNETTLKTFRDTDAGNNLVEYHSLDEMLADLKK